MQGKYFLKRLKPEEVLVDLRRKHVLVAFYKVFLALVIIIADFFFLFWLLQYRLWGLVAFFVILLAGAFWLSRSLVSWYFSVTIVSDQRVIEITQKGFFSRQQRECFFDKIEEVSYNKKGIFATIFNYGNLEIKTASESTGLEIKKVRFAESLKEKIIELQQQKIVLKDKNSNQSPDKNTFEEVNLDI